MSQAHTRSTDPETSRAAAAKIGDLGENQTAVLMVLRMAAEPLLDEQLIKEYERRQRSLMLPEQSESGIRSRRSELVDLGLVVAGERKKMTTGGTGTTWFAPARQD